jgi:hypothetical protein
MSYKLFKKSDLIFNTAKVKPRFEFTIRNGSLSINNGSGYVMLNSMLVTPQNLLTGSCLTSLDFSCIDNSFYLGVI